MEPRRTPATVLMGLGLVALVHVFSFADPPMPRVHGDGLYTYYWARSLAFDGDLRLENDYLLCGDPWHKLRDARPGLGPSNTWSPGPAALWTPLLWLGRGLGIDQGSGDPRLEGGCPESRLSGLAMVGSLLAGLLTVLLCYRMASRHVSPGAALVGAAGIGLASNLPYYSTLLPSYGHAPAAFAVALALERWDATRGSRSPWRWLLLGALVGFAMLMRAQCALVALAPLLEWAWLAREDLRAQRGQRLAVLVGSGLLFCAAALALFFPQMLAWKITFGEWLAVPQGPHYMRWTEPVLDGVLFSTTGGILFWTPILYASVVGLLLAPLRPRGRIVGVSLALMVAAFVYVNASVWDWWGSSGFSNRRFTELALPFAFGLALVAERVGAFARVRPRAFLGAVTCVVIAAFAMWNYAAMWGVAKGRIRSHREDRSDVFARQVFGQLSEGVWQEVGNPLALPASIPFALLYDTEPRRYDVMRGQGLFYQRFQDRSLVEGEGVVRFSGTYHALFAARGFEEETRRLDGRLAVVTAAPRATVLLPLFQGDAGALRVSYRGEPDAARPVRAALRWNGLPVATLDAPAEFTDTVLELPPAAPASGINVLEWEIVGGSLALHELEILRRETEE